VKLWLFLAAIWIPTIVGTYLLLRHAARLLREERAHSGQLVRCLRGNHLDTLDTEVDGLPKLAWRCTTCGARVLLGVAYATGSNRRSRGAKHG
jgi:hypothetical protein